MDQIVTKLESHIASGELSSAIQKMLNFDECSLAEKFSDVTWRTNLLGVVEHVAIHASSDEKMKAELHLALHSFYSLNFNIPDPGAPHPQFSPILIEVADSLESAFLEQLNQKLDVAALENAPADASKFRRWLIELIHSHEAFEHPYYHEFLLEDATKDDLRFFFSQESFLDARFDDALALLQLGTTGVVKNEIGSNFWDELGNGDLAGVHTDLFTKSLRAMGIAEDDLLGGGLTEALAQGNMSTLLVLKRRHFYKAVGFLFVTELLAPKRFKCVIKSGERNNLSEDALEYQRLHAEVDVFHAQGWMQNVIVPLVEENPSVRTDIALGVLYRLETSLHYLDVLYDRIQSERTKKPRVS